MACITRQDDISEVQFSVRVSNCLRSANIHTIGELLDYPFNELSNIPNMGAKSVGEIQRFIQGITSGQGEYNLVEPHEKRPPAANNAATAAALRSILVTALPLSVRAKNILTENGYTFASQLVGITREELMNMRNSGRKTAEEVLAFAEEFAVSYRESADTNKINASHYALVEEMCVAYGKEESFWLREILTVMEQDPNAEGETLIYHLYNSERARNAVKSSILRIVEGNNDEISITALEEKMPQHVNNTTILLGLLQELDVDSVIELGEKRICRKYPSIVEFVSQIENIRIRGIIEERLKGKTSGKIGKDFNITGAYVLQLVEKGMREKPRLREDQYTYIYEKYDFSLKCFTRAFDEPRETFYYLEMICQTPRFKRKPVNEILTDTTLSPEVREKVKRVIYT